MSRKGAIDIAPADKNTDQALFSFVFRLLGLVILALALVLAVLDITRSITASSLILTSLGDAWAGFNPVSFEAAKEAVTTALHPAMWDSVIAFILMLPSWFVFCLLAMVLLWLGRKKSSRFGRFASR